MSRKNQCREYAEMLAGIDTHGGHRLLLETGVAFTGRVHAASDPYAGKWAARHRPKTKECYYNSQSFVLDMASLRPEGEPFVYHEGFWGGGGIPIPHAWVVRGGLVIDMTAEACDRKSFGTGIGLFTSVDYFGVAVPVEFLRERIAKTRMWSDVIGAWLISQLRRPEPEPAPAA